VIGAGGTPGSPPITRGGGGGGQPPSWKPANSLQASPIPPSTAPRGVTKQISGGLPSFPSPPGFNQFRGPHPNDGYGARIVIDACVAQQCKGLFHMQVPSASPTPPPPDFYAFAFTAATHDWGSQRGCGCFSIFMSLDTFLYKPGDDPLGANKGCWLGESCWVLHSIFWSASSIDYF